MKVASRSTSNPLLLQVLMYYGSGTVDRIASGQPDNACSSERRADVMAAILKLWRHIRNTIPWIDAYVLQPGTAASVDNVLCVLARWRHFSVWHDVMAAILKVWH